MSYDGSSDIYNATHFVLDTNELAVYLRLYLLLFTDDTVMLAESGKELQAALHSMYLYCKSWDLEINALKTKFFIFKQA